MGLEDFLKKNFIWLLVVGRVGAGRYFNRWGYLLEIIIIYCLPNAFISVAAFRL